MQRTKLWLGTPFLQLRDTAELEGSEGTNRSIQHAELF